MKLIKKNNNKAYDVEVEFEVAVVPSKDFEEPHWAQFSGPLDQDIWWFELLTCHLNKIKINYNKN
jgi:hypothetical protein